MGIRGLLSFERKSRYCKPHNCLEEKQAVHTTSVVFMLIKADLLLHIRVFPVKLSRFIKSSSFLPLML